ncbi:putative P-type Ca(2+) transporter [Helianthus debilis subsp. tardiflorus]
MATKCQPLHCISTVTASFTEAKKRWRLAYLTTYFSNTMASIAKNVFSKALPVLELPPYSVIDHSIDIKQDSQHHFYDIDQTQLVNMVQNKDLETLRGFDGVKGLAKTLHSHLDNGVDGQDLSERRTVFGSNTYQNPPRKGLFYFVLEAFKEATILILMACAVLSFGSGIKEDGIKDGWYEGASILLVVCFVIFVSAVSNFRQEKQFDKLAKISNDIKIDVIREGRRQKISIFDIVVGDVVVLNLGDRIPADGLFIDGDSLLVDESSMTGESDQIDVNTDSNPFLISGAKVADGRCRMLVLSVGMNTAWGKMMSSITGDNHEQTPLQSRLNKLTSSIGKGGLAIAVLLRLVTGIFSTAVTIAVVAIPEGLPLAVTLALAYSMKKMMDDKAMVRKLSACETMGSATVICTDKTRTLTMNQMTVTKFWLGLEYIEQQASNVIASQVLELLHEEVGFNTTGSVFNQTSRSEREYVGSPTEKAILSWAVEDLDTDMEKLKQSSTVLHVETFNSQKKRSGVSIKRNTDNTIHVHWKGAAEMVLTMCSEYYDINGCKLIINPDSRTQL